MADDGGTFTAFRPVTARRVSASGREHPLWIGAGQHVVHIRGLVTTAWNCLALFSERRLLVDLVIRRMEIGHVSGDYHALGMPPGPFADAIACVDAGISAGRGRAQIGMPDSGLRAGRLGQCRAKCVGAFKPAEIGADFIGKLGRQLVAAAVGI